MEDNFKVEEKVAELEKEIGKAREAYYNLEPIMSDQEFDAKVELLKTLKADSKELTDVGAPVPKNSVWKKVKHDIPMGSLNKVNSENEFFEWCSKRGSEFVITPKLDGSSMSLVYKDGVLVHAITRGDGIEGEDILENVILVNGVRESIPLMGNVIVRGEILMKVSVFKEKYADRYANPRNTSAGKLREKRNNEACRDLNFLAYNLFVNEEQERTEFDQFSRILSLGFHTPNFVYGLVDRMKRTFELAKNERDTSEYEYDGMVIRMNSIQEQNELGSKNLRPEGQIAWKFDALAVESKMVDVRWSVGTTGRITPVAIIQPVNIGGVVVTNVSLHNVKMFKELQLKRGSRVLVARNNDVIPYLKANLDLVEEI